MPSTNAPQPTVGSASAGVALNPFSPDRRELVPLSSVTFLRVGGVQLTEGMKVFGQAAHQDAFTLTKMLPTKQELDFSVVAVLHPPAGVGVGVGGAHDNDNGNSISSSNTSEVPQSLLNCVVAGFINILKIDSDQGVMTLLAPTPGQLPSRYLLVGDIKYME
jgi:hypothetical protein